MMVVNDAVSFLDALMKSGEGMDGAQRLKMVTEPRKLVPSLMMKRFWLPWKPLGFVLGCWKRCHSLHGRQGVAANAWCFR